MDYRRCAALIFAMSAAACLPGVCTASAPEAAPRHGSGAAVLAGAAGDASVYTPSGAATLGNGYAAVAKGRSVTWRDAGVDGTGSSESGAFVLNEIDIPDIVRIPDYPGFKCYEDYHTITNTGTRQYALEAIAETDGDGFRKYDGCYLIAVGTGVSAPIGQRLDLVLDDGAVVPCIVGDIKSDQHTDSGTRLFTAVTSSPCCSEFLVDKDLLPDGVRQSGDCSAFQGLGSPVRKMWVYDENVLDGADGQDTEDAYGSGPGGSEG